MNQEKLQINSIEQFTDLITSGYKENYHGFAEDDLCDFFQNWYKWNPDLSTGLECIQRFSWLYYENKKGIEFVTSDPGNLMTFYYVVLNGQKMDSPASKDLVAKWMNELVVPTKQCRFRNTALSCFANTCFSPCAARSYDM